MLALAITVAVLNVWECNAATSQIQISSSIHCLILINPAFPLSLKAMIINLHTMNQLLSQLPLGGGRSV